MRDGNDQRRLLEKAAAEHGGLVRRIASTYERRPEVAEELVQETFAALWRALPRYRGEASLKTFTARIAHNVAVSHVRRASRTRSEPICESVPADGPDPEEAADNALRRELLVAAVRRLPLAQRQVVSLHLEGFADREIGEALGLSAGNVAVRLTRARAALKTMLGGSND